MTMKLSLHQLAAGVAVALIIGCSNAQNSARAQEGNSMLPKFFQGMTLLEENNCSSFTVKYYFTPEVTMADIKNSDTEKGYGFVVIPKGGIHVSKILHNSVDPLVISDNYFIIYQPPGKNPREITANVMDHAAPPESYTIPSPLFGENGVFYAGPSYHDVLTQSTNGAYGQGMITIDSRSAEVFRGSDGSSCTIQPPKIRFRIK